MEQLWLFPEAERFRTRIVKEVKPAPKNNSVFRHAKYAAAALIAAVALQPASAGFDESTVRLESVVEQVVERIDIIPAESAYNFLKKNGEEYLQGLGSKKQDYLLLVDKDAQVASVYRLSLEMVDSTRISTGRVAGNKEREGDMKTPNGLFQVVSQYDSSGWMHNGKLGEYGNHFSRLNAGAWDKNGHFYEQKKSSIGVHGTNQPEKIGTRASEGCIRLPNSKNEDYVASGVLKEGTIVAVVGDSYGK